MSPVPASPVLHSPAISPALANPTDAPVTGVPAADQTTSTLQPSSSPTNVLSLKQNIATLTPATEEPTEYPTSSPSLLLATGEPSRAESNRMDQDNWLTAEGTDISNIGADNDINDLSPARAETDATLSPKSESSGMTLSMTEVILMCVGMVAITLTALIAHAVYKRSKQSGNTPVGTKRTSTNKANKASGGHRRQSSNKRKEQKERRTFVNKVTLGLGRGGQRKKSFSSDGVIKQGAAVVISSTRSHRNHEACLVESLSSVSDSQASTLSRARGPHKYNNRVQIPRRVCEFPSELESIDEK